MYRPKLATDCRRYISPVCFATSALRSSVQRVEAPNGSHMLPEPSTTNAMVAARHAPSPPMTTGANPVGLTMVPVTPGPPVAPGAPGKLPPAAEPAVAPPPRVFFPDAPSSSSALQASSAVRQRLETQVL